MIIFDERQRVEDLLKNGFKSKTALLDFILLGKYLIAEGYSGNKAMHPFNPYNYNRPAVYKDFGFTDFIDKFDFPKNVKRVREYISDEANVDRIISEYEKNRKKTDQPFYMYNMTIQNQI